MSAQAVFCERGFLTALTFSVALIRVPAFSHPPLPRGAYNVISISNFAVKCEGEIGGEMVDRWKGGGIVGGGFSEFQPGASGVWVRVLVVVGDGGGGWWWAW